MRAGFAPRLVRGGAVPGCGRAGVGGDRIRLAHEAKPDLAAAGEFDIDLREQFGIEQRAVLHTVRAINAVTGA